MRADSEQRLLRVAKELDQLQRRIDDLHLEVVEALRLEGVTLEAISENYDPPKSRQALSSWLTTRRARRGGGP